MRSFALAESHIQYPKRCNATPPINGELFVINLFFFIMILFRRKEKKNREEKRERERKKKKQQFHYILKPIIISVTCLVYGTRVCSF